MTATTEPKVLPEATQEDLARRIAAAFIACNAARARHDLVAADAHWRHLIGLLEVQMGRTSSAEKLTMTPSPPPQR